MSAQVKTRQIRARVPEQLAEAVAQRADQLGRSTSDVVRQAVVRELSTPVDAKSRDYLSAWLNGEV